MRNFQIEANGPNGQYLRFEITGDDIVKAMEAAIKWIDDNLTEEEGWDIFAITEVELTPAEEPGK